MTDAVLVNLKQTRTSEEHVTTIRIRRLQVANNTTVQKSGQLLEQAKAKEITDDATAKEVAANPASDHLAPHRRSHARLAITATLTASSRNSSTLKDVLAPAEEALITSCQKF